MNEPIISVKTYAITYVSLLLLTLATTLLAYLDVGPLNTVLAIGIAVVKATLIAAVFMHVMREMMLVRLVIAGAIMWFVILISLTLSDYFTRAWFTT
jgi:cytochrome c oxidase subunit 4